MGYSRLKKSTVFETRCEDVSIVYDQFTRFCKHKANTNIWKINEDEAVDLAHDTIEKALNSAKNKDVDHKNHQIMSYLIGSCKRNLFDLYKSRYCRNSVKIKQVSYEGSQDRKSDAEKVNMYQFYKRDVHPLNAMIFMEIEAAFKEVFLELDQLDQKIWCLCYENRMSKKKMAENLGVNSNTFNSRYFRLPAKIAQKMYQRGFENFAFTENDDVPNSSNLLHEGIDLHLERVPSRKRKASVSSK
jgi:RNA polymerase sigma factor (sigma-70 family)